MDAQKEIKVLFVTHYSELYGANNSLLQLTLELRGLGISPTVLLPFGKKMPGNDLSTELNQHGIPYIETKIRVDKHPDWKKTLANYLLALSYRKDARKAINGMEFDLIHSNSSTMSVGAYLARKGGIPHVWHMREFGDLDYGWRTPFGKWFQGIIYGGRNTFIAISESIRSHFQPYVGRQDMRVIYNGIKASLSRPEGDHERVEICIVGILRKEKGQLELIKAADELVNRRGLRDFHITVVGGGDPVYAARIEDYISEHGLTDFVTMAGRRNDVPELLTKMDIGVMASTHEAFGRATVEYMMAGLATVASDGGASVEIIDDGVSGLLYHSGDHMQLADRLESLITQPELRKKLAAKGQETALSKFSSKANSDAVYSLYKEILKLK